MRCIVCNLNQGESTGGIVCNSKECLDKYNKAPWKYRNDISNPCKHENGWVIKEEVCIGQEDIEVECECNNIGCGERRKFFITISEGVESFN